MAEIERIVVVTKKTALEELIYRLNSKEQARFYLEQNQIPFRDYELEDQQYQQALASVKRQLPGELKQQFIEREFLSTYQFDEHDLVVTLGPDGLVINTAKYLTTQPILALNPDPRRVDGILIPFHYEEARSAVARLLQGRGKVTRISMVKAGLNDGQVLYGINDLFIGPRTHTSARYRLQLGSQSEAQISSGIIVSTGAGCTGWFRSITQGAWSVASYFGGGSAQPPSSEQLALGWESEQAWFTVREPFVSRISQANLVFGQLQRGQELVITSQMPENGVIFSDGIESDYLAFPSGFIARIGLAERKAHLVVRK
ncbi:sugar kinase [Dictyobacter sp. S3.2.2.5]|uniref:Sugar kinase n=1 Tax=Dictyobacter halimunensis TaxID=3026934 RepID=A0ABQ6FPJ0_9CHLR|nr:sugar kinase [Dictyobacter sp. S3.2.2.5]